METLIPMNMVFIRDKYNLTTMDVTTQLLSKFPLHVRGPSYTSTFIPKFLIGSSNVHTSDKQYFPIMYIMCTNDSNNTPFYTCVSSHPVVYEEST